MKIAIDDPAKPDVYALLQEHLKSMFALSPPESVHALDVSALKQDGISFWTIRDGSQLLGCGALKTLSAEHGEIKSMRTATNYRRRGAGRALLVHIIHEAKSRGFIRLSLETGTAQSFIPAQRLYASAGFLECGPFGDYKVDPHSLFMTLDLSLYS